MARQPEDTPADRPPSPWALERKLDKLQSSVDLLLKDRDRDEEARKHDRFLLMEHEFKVIKRLAWVCVTAGMGALVAVVIQFMSGHVRDPLPPPRSGDVTALDSVVKPHPPRDGGQRP